MDSNINFFLIIALIIGLIYFFDKKNNYQQIENWINYKNLSFGNWETASEPVNFYNRPEYRKPYRWPVCHNVDYPVPHCRHL